MPKGFLPVVDSILETPLILLNKSKKKTVTYVANKVLCMREASGTMYGEHI